MSDNKTYLILGASSDLGLYLMQQLLEQQPSGLTIVAHFFRSSEEIEKIAVNYPNARVLPMQADLSDLKQVRRLVSDISEREITPTHIVDFCAADFTYTRFSEWNSELVNKDMTIQVYALAEILRTFIPTMVQDGKGKIVVMLSASMFSPPPKNLSGYVTVKYALLGLIKCISSEYGDKGININGISPEMVNTKFLRNIGRKIKEMTAERNSRHRNLEVRDVIPTVLFLLSDEAEFINGVNVNLSGRAE